MNAILKALSNNHCCLGKAISITYSESVFVALVIRHAMRMRRVLPHYVINSTIFGSGVPRNFVRGEGSTNSVEDRGGGSPLIRGSGGSCTFVQEISFRIVKFS